MDTLRINSNDFDGYASETDILLAPFASSGGLSDSFRLLKREIDRNSVLAESFIPSSSQASWRRNLAVRLGSCLFLGLIQTFLWQLVPLGIGISEDDKKDGYANYWGVGAYLGIYLIVTIFLCFYVYTYFMDAWDRKVTLPVTIITCILGVGLTLSSGFTGVRFLERHTAKFVVTFTVVFSIMFGTVYAMIKNPHEKRKWFLNGLAVLGGAAISSLWWNMCQFFSKMFLDSHGTSAQTVILTLYGLAYVVMARLLQVVLKISTHKQSDIFFWLNYLFAMLYYVYYRNLFTAIEGWMQFFLLHGLHMLSELFLIIPFSHLFISLFNHIAPIPCMQISHEEMYYKRACQTYCVREIAKIYTIVAMIIFVFQIRHWENRYYYPLFSDISENEYQHFVEFLFAMLAAVLLSTIMCFLLITYYLKVQIIKIGLDILFKNSFWIGLTLACVHTTNDAYFTLLDAKYKM